ncbi:MAG: hypothetical protein GEV10_02165 [Streptosporangiales bacterium]|nr:hypothetical protein [Streptosporangiales bacterium]
MSHDPGTFDVDEAIRDAHARVRRHDQLRSQRRVVAEQLTAVEERVQTYEAGFAAERKDVERLERGGFARLISDLVGGRETKLQKERVEAEAAWQKLLGEQQRRDQIAADLAGMDSELAALGDARDRYDYAVNRKAAQLTAAGDPRGTRLAEIQSLYRGADVDLREYTEAHEAGTITEHLLGKMEGHLGRAIRRSGADVAGDATNLSPWADYYKHKHLGAADEVAWAAQRALDVFGRELADVGVTADVTLPKVDTRWFADMFIDNIVIDWARHRRIQHTLEEVDDVAAWVRATLAWLKARVDELAAYCESLSTQRSELLTSE